MARKKVALNCYIDHELRDRLNKWVEAQPYGATRTAVIEKLLRDFLDGEAMHHAPPSDAKKKRTR